MYQAIQKYNSLTSSAIWGNAKGADIKDDALYLQHSGRVYEIASK